MRAGFLRHRLILQSPSTTQNTYGETATSWSDVTTIWASIEPLRGKEYFAAKEIQAEVTHRITIRYRAGMVPTYRLLDGSDNIYRIEAIINPENRNKELQLMCVQEMT